MFGAIYQIQATFNDLFFEYLSIFVQMLVSTLRDSKNRCHSYLLTSNLSIVVQLALEIEFRSFSRSLCFCDQYMDYINHVNYRDLNDVCVEHCSNQRDSLYEKSLSESVVQTDRSKRYGLLECICFECRFAQKFYELSIATNQDISHQFNALRLPFPSLVSWLLWKVFLLYNQLDVRDEQ